MQASDSPLRHLCLLQVLLRPTSATDRVEHASCPCTCLFQSLERTSCTVNRVVMQVSCSFTIYQLMGNLGISQGSMHAVLDTHLSA